MGLRLISSLSALVFGLAIVAVSLTAVSPVLSNTDETNSSERELYWGEQILPDHVAYPVLMMIDKIRLEAASDEERVALKLEYSQRRFSYIADLLADDRAELAYSTLIKSQLYLVSAAEDLKKGEAAHYKTNVINALVIRDDDLRSILSSFADDKRPRIEQMISVSEGLALDLQSI